MTILDRYLGGRMLGMLARILLGLYLLFVLIDFVVARNTEVLKYNVPLHIIALYYATYIPTLFFTFQAAAWSVLLAGLLVLGRAAQDNEITAALAGGIRLGRLVRMPVIIAFFMMVLAFVVEETAGVRMTKLVQEIDQKYFSRYDQPVSKGQSWTNLEGGWTCHVLKFNRKALTGQDVSIHAFRENQVEEIRANRIFWDAESGAWILEDGYWHIKQADQAGSNVGGHRITQEAAPFHEPPEALFSLEAPVTTRTVSAVYEDLKLAEAQGKPVTSQWAQFHAKFSRPVLCFIMIWLAIPFAVRLRRGGMAVGFGISISLALAYFLVFYASMGLGQLGKLPPVAAAWSANLVFAVLAAILYRRAPG
ncbi:MAG: LptF/LptG family permease [Candidatus Hydrogenedentes bacterium]|nr:LptF/LptG family permease [Candidatus Hydrogenedentota bacterium]